MTLYVRTLFPDIIWIILIGIYYGLGKDQHCSIDAKSYLIAYIVVKVVLMLSRAFFIGLGCILGQCIGVILLVVGVLTWAVTIWVYYSVLLSAFFGDSNDCKDKAPELYNGMLVVVIEAWMIGTILAIFGVLANIGWIAGVVR